MSLIKSVIFRWLSPLTGSEHRELPAAQDLPPDENQLPSTGAAFQKSEMAYVPPPDDFMRSIAMRYGDEAIYKRLVAVAQGDTNAVLRAMDVISRSHQIDESPLFDCLREVAKYRPYEAGHLMMRLFDRASTNTRLAILREFVVSPLGDKQAVGDLFISLFERSTRDERRAEIYPALLEIIDEAALSPAPIQGKRALLSWLLRGWMSEI